MMKKYLMLPLMALALCFGSGCASVEADDDYDGVRSTTTTQTRETRVGPTVTPTTTRQTTVRTY